MIVASAGAITLNRNRGGTHALVAIAEAVAAARNRTLAETNATSVLIFFSQNGTTSVTIGEGGPCNGCFFPTKWTTYPEVVSSSVNFPKVFVVANPDGRLIAGDPGTLASYVSPPPCPAQPVQFFSGGEVATVDCESGRILLSAVTPSPSPSAVPSPSPTPSPSAMPTDTPTPSPTPSASSGVVLLPPQALYFSSDATFASQWGEQVVTVTAVDSAYQSTGDWSDSYAYQLSSNATAGQNVWLAEPYWPYAAGSTTSDTSGNPICGGVVSVLGSLHAVNYPNSGVFTFTAGTPGRCEGWVVTAKPDSQGNTEVEPIDVFVYGAVAASQSSVSLSPVFPSTATVSVSQLGIGTFTAAGLSVSPLQQYLTVDDSNCRSKSIASAATQLTDPDTIALSIRALGTTGSCSLTVQGAAVSVPPYVLSPNYGMFASQQPPAGGSSTTSTTIAVSVN